MTFSPDPFGLLGFHSVDGPMDVIVDSDGPRLLAGIDLPQEQRILRGQLFERRWIVTQDGGGENPDLFEELSTLWGLGKGRTAPVYAPSEIDFGCLLPEPYVVTLQAENYGCVAAFPSPARLPNRIIPITVKGLQNNWSAGALRLDGTQPTWYPGGLLEGTLWIALEEEGRYFLGHPLVCDDPAARLEIHAIQGDRIAFALHNPCAESKTVGVVLAAALQGPRTVERYRLDPGAVASCSITWTKRGERRHAARQS